MFPRAYAGWVVEKGRGVPRRARRAFYLQLDLEIEPRELGRPAWPCATSSRAEAKSAAPASLSEKNRPPREGVRKISAGALTILPRSPALADASIDIMYGLHGLHCMNSISTSTRSCCESYGPAGNSGLGLARATATRAWRTERCARGLRRREGRRHAAPGRREVDAGRRHEAPLSLRHRRDAPSKPSSYACIRT